MLWRRDKDPCAGNQEVKKPHCRDPIHNVYNYFVIVVHASSTD